MLVSCLFMPNFNYFYVLCVLRFKINMSTFYMLKYACTFLFSFGRIMKLWHRIVDLALV